MNIPKLYSGYKGLRIRSSKHAAPPQLLQALHPRLVHWKSLNIFFSASSIRMATLRTQMLIQKCVIKTGTDGMCFIVDYY